MYFNAIYQLCKFIPNCMAIDQSNVNFTQLLRAVKDWVLCILNIKIEYFVCRFLGRVLILILDEIYENILSLTSI